MTKKLLVAMVALLVLALAAPAHAAPKLVLGGSLENKLEATEAGVNATSDLQIELGMELGSGDKIKAHVGFEPIKWAPFFQYDPLPDDESDPAALPVTPSPMSVPGCLKIDRAYLQTVGSYWEGGPEVTTTLGDLTVDYSPYVAAKDETDAVIEGAMVDGVKMGPVQMSGFYGWDPNSGATIVSRGATLAADLEGLGLSGTIVKSGVDELAFVGNARFAPIKGVEVQGTFARDEAHEASATKLDAALNTIPSVGVKVGYRDFDAAFDPRYRDRATDEDGNPINIVDMNSGERGITAEASTKLAGMTVTGSVDQFEKEDVAHTILGSKRILGAKAETQMSGFNLNGSYELATSDIPGDEPEVTTMKFGAEKGFAVGESALKAKYNLTVASNAETEHEAEASMITDAPGLKGIQLDGKYKLVGAAATYYAGATYRAPNGITLGLHYDHGYDDDIAEGLSATAGLKVGF